MPALPAPMSLLSSPAARRSFDRAAPRARTRPWRFACAALALSSCTSTTPEFDALAADFRAIPATLWNDAKALYSDPRHLTYLAGGAGLALAAESSAAEAEVARYVRDDAFIGDETSAILDLSGEGTVVLGLASASYLYARFAERDDLVDISRCTLRAVSQAAIATTLLKTVTSDRRPDTGTSRAFPSGHSSGSMALAVCLQQQYGSSAGVPAFLLSVLIGIQRIERRRHDLGDVVFGWILGYSTAKALYRHESAELHAELAPKFDLERRFVGLNWSLSF